MIDVKRNRQMDREWERIREEIERELNKGWEEERMIERTGERKRGGERKRQRKRGMWFSVVAADFDNLSGKYENKIDC